jgi:hypothetical protein
MFYFGILGIVLLNTHNSRDEISRLQRQGMPRDDSLAAAVDDLAKRFPEPALPPAELLECAQGASVRALLYGCELSTGTPHTGFVCTRVLLEMLHTRSSSASDLCAHDGMMRLFSVASSCNVAEGTRALAVRCMAAAAEWHEQALAHVRADERGLLAWACATVTEGTLSEMRGALVELLAVAVLDDDARGKMLLWGTWADVSQLLGRDVHALQDDDVSRVLFIMTALLHSEHDANAIWQSQRGNADALVHNLANVLVQRDRHALEGAIHASALRLLEHTLVLEDARAAMARHGVLGLAVDQIKHKDTSSCAVQDAVALLGGYLERRQFAPALCQSARARACFEELVPRLVALLYERQRYNYERLCTQALRLMHALVDTDASFAGFIERAGVRNALAFATRQRAITTHRKGMTAQTKLLAALDSALGARPQLRSARRDRDAAVPLCQHRPKRQKCQAATSTLASP